MSIPKRVPHLSKLLMLILITANLQAQTISGTVQDEGRGRLESVTVTLLKVKDSSLVKGVLTDSSGKFEMKNIPSGRYFISFYGIGYAKVNTQPFDYSGNEIIVDPVLLKTAVKELGTVTVTSTKPLIEQTDEKIIYNTSVDPSTKSETVLDILRKTPFVSIDGNENIQVNGQSNFKILLNGRETGIFSQNVSQALKSLSGASILKIEVITNPSAKYDAEGVGGIINIVTQKKIVGYNGIASLTVNSIHSANGNLTFNIKKGKVGISLNYNFVKQGYFGLQFPPYLVYSEITANNSQTYTSRTSDGSTIQNLFQNNGYAEFNYEMDSLKTLSIYSAVSGGNNNLFSSVQNQTNFPTFSSSSIFDFQNNIQNPTYNAGIDFVKKFRKHSDQEFSLRLFTIYSENNSFLNSYQDNPGNDRYLINTNYANNTQTTIQSDYLLPLKGNDKLEVGLKLILRNAMSEYESLSKTNPNDQFVIIPGNTNDFAYRQHVYSGFGSHHFKIKKWIFRTGIRVEHTNVKGNFRTSGMAVNQNYTNIIPNVQASTAATKTYKIVISYGQRIQRPFINSLNPFVNNNDTLNISYGNPELKPQLIHNLALQNTITKGKVFAGLTLACSYSNDKVIEISNFNRTTGVTTTESQNLGREWQLSLNCNLTARITNFWNMSFNSNLQYTSIKNLLDNGQQNKGISGSFGISNTLKVNSKFTVSTFVGRFIPPIGLQGHSSGQWFYNITPSYKLLKDKLTVSFAAVRFITQYMTVKTILSDDNFYAENFSSGQVRNFRMGITWNFGKLNENISKKKGVNNDDIIK